MMPDGSILKGGQGNQSDSRCTALGMRAGSTTHRTGSIPDRNCVDLLKSQWAVPWLRPDPIARIDAMSVEEIGRCLRAVPRVRLRQRTNIFLSGPSARS